MRRSTAKSLAELSEVLQAQLMGGDWGAFEGAAFEKSATTPRRDVPVGERERAVRSGRLRPQRHRRGISVPTDFDGNLIFYDMLYEHDLLPSEVATAHRRAARANGAFGHTAYGDPSIWHRTGQRNKWGAPAMLADEFTDNGVPLHPANNDPRAGLIRFRELLEPDPTHPFPNWHPRAGEPGAPRLFFVAPNCPELVDQLRSAPLQPIDKRDGGEIIDPKWESRYGHAVAMCRYAVMTRPARDFGWLAPDDVQQLREEIAELRSQLNAAQAGQPVVVSLEDALAIANSGAVAA
jgi:hypothetical protein